MNFMSMTVDIDDSVLATLAKKVEDFVQNVDPDLAKATLRIEDVKVDPCQCEQYGIALRDELCSMYAEWLYFVSVTAYTGRNGRHFADVHIEMKRGLLI